MTRSTSTRAANQHRRERRRLLRAGAATLGAALLPSFAARAQEPTSARGGAPETSAQRLAPQSSAAITTTDLGGIALLQVADCNVLALHGADGALLIDGGPAATADALVRSALAATHDARVAMLINTHWHLDQIGANEIVGRAGGTIFATEKTKLFLSHSVYADSFDRARDPLPDWSVRARRCQHRCAQLDEALDDRFADPFGACRDERSHACEIQCVQCHIRYEVVNCDTFILAIHNLFHKNARKSK